MIYPAKMFSEQARLSYQHLGVESELRQDVPHVLVVGLPGIMATLVAEALVQNKSKYELLPFAITSNRHKRESFQIGGKNIKLYEYCPRGVGDIPGVIAVDFSSGRDANTNALLYVMNGIPFVMGTTGGDSDTIEENVRRGSVNAVIAPNMAPEVVQIQIELEDLLRTNPHKYAGWNATILESHQASKQDVSGTAIALRKQLEALGATIGKIDRIRDPRIQKELGIQNLDGHAYHWINLDGPNGETQKYNSGIEGRQPYIDGTLMALDFLNLENKKKKAGSPGEVFSMIKVIRARRQHE